MTNTTNYNLNIVEGTDVVNPLVQFNPNFTTIDTAMKANSDAAIDRATCVKSGTNHAVTRTNTDASVFRFTATGDWNTGDTMTVDATPVSVYTPNGTSLLTGAFVINTEVIASINGTRVVVYTANTKATSIDAVDVVYDNSISGLSSITAQGAIDELRTSDNILYDNTVSGLTATDVKSAIDELAVSGTVYTKIAESTAGNTYASQLGELVAPFAALTKQQKMSAKIVRTNDNAVYNIGSLSAGDFSRATIGSTSIDCMALNLNNSTVKYLDSSLHVVDASANTTSASLELWVMM